MSEAPLLTPPGRLLESRARIDKLLEDQARAVAHRHCRCSGGTGYGPGGDGPRHHSQRCDDLTSDILRMVASVMRAIEEGKP